MKTKKVLVLLLLSLSLSMFAQEEDDMDLEMQTEEEIQSDDMNHDDLMADAEMAKKAFLDANSNLKEELKAAAGYVIFPNVGKGALVVGVSSGNGVVYAQGQVAGHADMKKMDVGVQAGGKSFSELIIFKTDEAFERFKNNEFEFAAGASAVVLKSGIETQAKYNDGVAVYAISKGGLMVEAAVGGQKFKFKPIS